MNDILESAEYEKTIVYSLYTKLYYREINFGLTMPNNEYVDILKIAGQSTIVLLQNKLHLYAERYDRTRS